MVPKFSKILPKLSSELSPELIQSLGKIPWDFQLIHSTTELHLFIFLGPKFKIYDMIMVSLRIIKYCYDSPMEKKRNRNRLKSKQYHFKASPPYSNSFSESESLGVRKISELGTQTWELRTKLFGFGVSQGEFWRSNTCHANLKMLG